MRTPGHAVVNLAPLAMLVQPTPPPLAAAVVTGAVLPDLPIIALFAIHRVKGTPRTELWRVHYQKPFWLNLIHGLHSIPGALAGAALGWLFHAPVLIALFASMFAHDLLDLPLHARDAHRHFLPFSNWRFESPLSYWDVTRKARWVTPVEWLLVAAATVVLVRVLPSSLPVLLAVHLYYAWDYWMLFVSPEPTT